MSDQRNETGPEVDAAKQEAADHVVERVESWQDGAEEATVREELEDGMQKADVEASDRDLDKVAEQIHETGKGDAPPVS